MVESRRTRAGRHGPGAALVARVLAALLFSTVLLGLFAGAEAANNSATPTKTSVPATATRTRTPTTVPITATPSRTPTRTPTSIPATATRTPTRTATAVPVTLCNAAAAHSALTQGKLRGNIASVSGNVATVSITNDHLSCAFEVGAASYIVPDADGHWHNETIGDQILFHYNDFTIQPRETRQVSLNLPNCVTQTDVYYGRHITNFDPDFYYNTGYNGQDRKLDTDNFHDGVRCILATPTRTPTTVPATPTRTPSMTPVPPSPTRTRTPVSATVTTVLATPTTPINIPIQAEVRDYTCTGYGSENARWVFVIDRLSTAAQAPVSIQVTWDYGAMQTVPLDTVVPMGSTGLFEAHYVAISGAWSLGQASAVIAAPWSGRFYVREGNCKPVVIPGETPELGSLILFGSGLTGAAGYAYRRFRYTRRGAATLDAISKMRRADSRESN